MKKYTIAAIMIVFLLGVVILYYRRPKPGESYYLRSHLTGKLVGPVSLPKGQSLSSSDEETYTVTVPPESELKIINLLQSDVRATLFDIPISEAVPYMLAAYLGSKAPPVWIDVADESKLPHVTIDARGDISQYEVLCMFASQTNLRIFIEDGIIIFSDKEEFEFNNNMTVIPINEWVSRIEYGPTESTQKLELVANNPYPVDNASDVSWAVILNWAPGLFAQTHDVYFGTDEEAVKNATKSSPEYKATYHIGSEGFVSGILEFNTTYYWRVDEVNDAHPDQLWKGNVWSFTVGNYFVIDDFESYNDIPEDREGSNLVYRKWTDGFKNPQTNGSIIGHVIGSSTETTIVHSGRQSVPLQYDNSLASSSEVTVNTIDLPLGQNWTKSGAETLALWFYGDPNNSTTEQMYIRINHVKVAYSGDPGNLTRRQWTRWNINLAALGINLNNITTLTIGFEKTGETGSRGMILIDDIRLYRPAIHEQ